MADLYAKAKKKGIDVIPVGTTVSWHYRGASPLPEGKVTGIYKLGKTSAKTEYTVKPKKRFRHPGEPPTLHHYGSALTRS